MTITSSLAQQEKKSFLTAEDDPFIRWKFYVVNVVLHVNGAANLLDDNDDVAAAADDEAKYILYLASFIIMSDYTDHTYTMNEKKW